MYTNKIKRVYIEAKNGVLWSYSNKWLVATLSLCIVIGVNELGASLTLPNVNAQVTYIADPTHNQEVLAELNDYVNMRSQEIYERNQSHYKELARQEAIQLVGNDLVKLSEVSPHVDYDYMREAIKVMR